MLFLRTLRQSAGLTQTEVAKLIGLSRQTYSAYEAGRRSPDPETLGRLAEIFGVTVDYIVRGAPSRPECLPIPDTKQVPRLGTVACGKPILAVENYDTYDEVPTSIHCDFTVKAKGDSMSGARIQDGDIVYIKKQDECDSGDIVAVLLNDEVVLKRFLQSGNTIMLMSENAKYMPIIVHPEDSIRILGKAVGFVTRL